MTSNRERALAAMNTGSLTGMLYNGAGDDGGVRAAVWLLVQHRSWFGHRAFMDLIEVDETRNQAFINWALAAQRTTSHDLSLSHSADQVLLFACALADGVPVDLRRVIAPLDTPNARLVADAFRKACRVT